MILDRKKNIIKGVVFFVKICYDIRVYTYSQYRRQKKLSTRSSIMDQYTLIGHPLGHSMSPWIHERLFRLAGVQAEYTEEAASEILSQKEVEIIADSGKVVYDEDGEIVTLGNYNSEVGGARSVFLSSGASTTEVQVLSTLMAIDHIREKLFSANPVLKLMYAVRDDLVESRMEIDVGKIGKAGGADA